eukprot:6202073-Pleurochrysis_carterae.AAC.4
MASTLCAQALEKNRTLTRLNLDHNKLGDEGLQALTREGGDSHRLSVSKICYHGVKHCIYRETLTPSDDVDS